MMRKSKAYEGLCEKDTASRIPILLQTTLEDLDLNKATPMEEHGKLQRSS